MCLLTSLQRELVFRGKKSASQSHNNFEQEESLILISIYSQPYGWAKWDLEELRAWLKLPQLVGDSVKIPLVGAFAVSYDKRKLYLPPAEGALFLF